MFGQTVFFDWVDRDWLIALSASLAYFLTLITVGFTFTLWKNSGRFRHWNEINDLDRAGAIMNVSLIFVFMHAAYLRLLAIEGYLSEQYHINAIAKMTAPTLPFICLASCGILYWICCEMLGTARAALWPWSLVILGGIIAGVMAGFVVFPEFP